MLLTAGVYRFSQQVSSPAADKKNKHLPKKMKANAKMSHRFPGKIPFKILIMIMFDLKKKKKKTRKEKFEPGVKNIRNIMTSTR